jgi:hypothetical protein
MLNALFRRLSSIALTFVLLASASSQAFADVVGYVNYDQIRNGYEKAQRLIGEIKVKDAGLRKNQADYVKQIEDSRAINGGPTKRRHRCDRSAVYCDGGIRFNP